MNDKIVSMRHNHFSDGKGWGVREIRESSAELLDLLDHKHFYLPYLQKMTTENRKREWLAVRVLLKELLDEEKEILYTESGCPYLADRSGRISISHTKGCVAVAWSNRGAVGVDIEYLASRIKKITSRFMSESEFSNVSPENEIVHLLLHWSAKESMFKALNESDVEFRTCLHVSPFVPEMNILSSFHAFETKTEKRHDFSIDYLATDDYVLTVTFLDEGRKG
ncbi:MAG: 4'-phosphopantetheinyl transferase superfamily protein [Candidatus Azobacteroides sp.]|nr:4'-phosphopantetheinyl transferase superfamily protein [Candidatus Azobacteroides sp.]